MGDGRPTALEGRGSAGYRYSSKRVAFGGPGRVRLGGFIRGTHRVSPT
ncbi:MAG: hypothetical protein IPN77_33565 [Sandaracinaceae bacterium]|nr:hypothetical protein [Sandaracinaceae bacterium]